MDSEQWSNKYIQTTISVRKKCESIFLNIAASMKRYYRPKRGLYCLSDIPTKLIDSIDKKLLQNRLFECLDISNVISWDHKKIYLKFWGKVQTVWYYASDEKRVFWNFFWFRHENGHFWMHPKTGDIETIETLLDWNSSKSVLEALSILRAIQQIAIVLLTYLDNCWGTPNGNGKKDAVKNKNIGKLRKLLNKITCLALFAKEKHQIVTNDRNCTRMRVSLWQEQCYGSIKTNTNASSFLKGTMMIFPIEKK